MQSKYFKFLIIALIIALVILQITLASWQNPFSWGAWNKIFYKTAQKVVIPDYQSETISWKTYINNEFGFQVKYYPDDKIQSYYYGRWDNSVGLNVDLEKVKIEVSKINVKPSCSKIYTDNSDAKVMADVEINGLKGREYRVEGFGFDSGKFDYRVICFENDKYSYFITSASSKPGDDGQHQKDVEIIAYNFKLIPINQYENWKTFFVETALNSKFSIKYPSYWYKQDFGFPCENNEQMFTIISWPDRPELPGNKLEHLTAAYLLQYCIGDKAIIKYQGFVKSPSSRQLLINEKNQLIEDDKIILSNNDLQNTAEYRSAREIINTVEFIK